MCLLTKRIRSGWGGYTTLGALVRLFTMLTALNAAFMGGILKLTGSKSQIVMNQATMSIQCPNAVTPSFSFLHPQEMVFDPADTSATVFVQLRHVASTCIDVDIDQPCAADHTAYPKLFSCTYSGVGGAVSTGPIAAQREADNVGSVQVAIRTFLNCPVLSGPDLVNAVGHTPGGGAATYGLNLSISHAGVAIPFRGVPGGDAVRVTFQAPPTVPPSPPAPPPHTPAVNYWLDLYVEGTTGAATLDASTGLSAFASEYESDVLIRIEWGTGSYIQFKSPNGNPFIAKPGHSSGATTTINGNTLTTNGAKLFELTEFTTSDSSLAGWVSTAGGAVFAMGWAGSKDSAWGIKPR